MHNNEFAKTLLPTRQDIIEDKIEGLELQRDKLEDKIKTQAKTIEGLKQEKAGIQNQLDFFIGGIAYKRIEELEKGNRELYAKLTANRFIFKTTVRNEYLDKIVDLELQRDGQSITIKELDEAISTLNKENNQLVLDKMKLESKLAPTIELLKNEMLERGKLTFQYQQNIAKLQEENYDYESQLKEIKTLNRQEVEEICYNDFFQRDIDGMVTAILNLAYDKKKIIEVLDMYGMEFDSQEVTSESVAVEIINSLNGKEGK